ncbi:hypothetical protein GCM10023175_23650 [Pseudonocardia xishanensis]|uniref:Uncharacterized protein n=1 Tax=Pseudonocardia xishanensis TaxID=630995 RepID=A0ABP8RQP9_9PSEU
MGTDRGIAARPIRFLGSVGHQEKELTMIARTPMRGTDGCSTGCGCSKPE